MTFMNRDIHTKVIFWVLLVFLVAGHLPLAGFYLMPSIRVVSPAIAIVLLLFAWPYWGLEIPTFIFYTYVIPTSVILSSASFYLAFRSPSGNPWRKRLLSIAAITVLFSIGHYVFPKLYWAAHPFGSGNDIVVHDFEFKE